MIKEILCRSIIFIISILTILGICQEIWLSENSLTVNHYQFETSKTNQEIKLVVLSDLHEHEFGEGNEALVELVKDRHPDLILLLGDFVNEDSEDTDIVCNLIEDIKNFAPIYFALGNHEIAYMERQNTELIQQLGAAGAIVLEKDYVDIEIKNEKIRLGGLYEYAFGFDREDLSDQKVAIKTYLEDFQETDTLKIMMSHRPDSFVFGDASTHWDVDLVVSGHNHGGQVVIPGLGGLFGGDQGCFPEYVHGMYQIDKINLFVTSGLGSNPKLLPRFNNRPEIAVITIL